MSEGNDEDLIVAVFREHYDRMVNHAFRLTGNRDDAEDVTSQVFLALAEEIRRGRAPNNAGAWLYRSVGNRAISLRRRATVRTGAVGDVWRWLTGAQQSRNHAKKEEDLATVRRALLKLRDKDRQVIVLRYDEEMEFATIASILGVSETSVRVRLSRAMERLRKIVEELENE